MSLLDQIGTEWTFVHDLIDTVDGDRYAARTELDSLTLTRAIESRIHRTPGTTGRRQVRRARTGGMPVTTPPAEASAPARGTLTPTATPAVTTPRSNPAMPAATRTPATVTIVVGKWLTAFMAGGALMQGDDNHGYGDPGVELKTAIEAAESPRTPIVLSKRAAKVLKEQVEAMQTAATDNAEAKGERRAVKRLLAELDEAGVR